MIQGIQLMKPTQLLTVFVATASVCTAEPEPNSFSRPNLPLAVRKELVEYGRTKDWMAFERAIAAVESETAPDMDGAIRLRIRFLEAIAPLVGSLGEPERPLPGHPDRLVRWRIRTWVDTLAVLCTCMPGSPADVLAERLEKSSVPPEFAACALRAAFRRTELDAKDPSHPCGPALKRLLRTISRHAVSSFRPALPAFREPAERARAELAGGTEPSAVLRELFDALAAVRAPKGGRALAAYARDKTRFLVASDPPLRLAAPEAFAAECAAVRDELSERLSSMPAEMLPGELCAILENALYALGAETEPKNRSGFREHNETTNNTGDIPHGRNAHESF